MDMICLFSFFVHDHVIIVCHGWDNSELHHPDPQHIHWWHEAQEQVSSRTCGLDVLKK